MKYCQLMNSSELFSLRRPNTHQVKTLISLIPFRPSARSITWYEESAYIPLLSLLLFPPLFLPLPPSSPSQFFWPRSCVAVFHQIWVFDKGQNDSRKKRLFQTALQVWRFWSTWAAVPTARQSVTTSMQQLAFQTSGGQRMSTLKRSAK